MSAFHSVGSVHFIHLKMGGKDRMVKFFLILSTADLPPLCLTTKGRFMCIGGVSMDTPTQKKSNEPV